MRVRREAAGTAGSVAWVAGLQEDGGHLYTSLPGSAEDSHGDSPPTANQSDPWPENYHFPLNQDELWPEKYHFPLNQHELWPENYCSLLNQLIFNTYRY